MKYKAEAGAMCTARAAGALLTAAVAQWAAVRLARTGTPVQATPACVRAVWTTVVAPALAP